MFSDSSDSNFSFSDCERTSSRRHHHMRPLMADDLDDTLAADPPIWRSRLRTYGSSSRRVIVLE